jgi:hypothetical protein
MITKLNATRALTRQKAEAPISLNMLATLFPVEFVVAEFLPGSLKMSSSERYSFE